jgi:anti-sigma regulatory factor (Ser/Thr protein kinase)
MPSDVVLWVPATSSHIHLLRTVAAGACASLGLSYDDIEDIRLAVAEAASQLLQTRPPADATIVMRLAHADRRLEVSVLLTGSSRTDGERLRAATEGSLAWVVLQALGNDVRVSEDGQGVGIAFSRHAAPVGLDA